MSPQLLRPLPSAPNTRPIKPMTLLTLGNVPADIDDAIIVRQSTVNSFQLCPARVGYEMAGLVESPVSDALVFGTLTHDLIEQHLVNGRAKYGPANFDENAATILLEQYNWTIDEIPHWKQFRRDIVEAYKLWIFQVYEHFLRNEVRGKRKFYVEEDLYYRFGVGKYSGKPIYGRGTPDLAIQPEMWDFKTTSNSYFWTQEKADTQFQPTYYLALHNANMDWQLQDFKFCVYDRKKHDWNVLSTSRTIEQQQAALRLAEAYGQQMDAEVFPATPFTESYGKPVQGWYCSTTYCGAWNVCEFKQLGSKDATEEAVIEWR